MTACVTAQGGAPGSEPASVQPVDPDAPNLVHDRHHHVHNKPHPRSPDASRFLTTRPDAIQLPLPEEKDAFTFVVFGDRTGGPPEGINVLADAVRDTNLLEPDFVITVGDLIQGYGEAPEWMRDMKEYKSVMGKLLCPWFPVAGNHDVYWRDKDGSGDARPPEEHEKNYEMHFGPLWYAFRHKNSWFIIVYTDEANPQTGERNFNKPENHEMSDEQFQFIDQMLTKAKDADHVFLFMHHPRWTGGNYGQSWERVHKRLVEAGNVTAVFAGHIHRMRYDPRDGIDYVTLATVGGGQSGVIPSAGFLHQYHVVTVRKDQVAMAAFPVGAAMNVREMTHELQQIALKIHSTPTPIASELKLNADGSAEGIVRLTVKNPTTSSVDATASLDSRDSRWRFTPDHDHGMIKPNSERTFVFHAERPASPIDETFRPVEVVLNRDLLAPSARYPLPEARTPAPISVDDVSGVSSVDRMLRVGGKQEHVVLVPDRLSPTTDRITVECMFRAESFPERTGVLSKAQSGDYGLFINNGIPQFSYWAGSGYVSVRAARPLELGRWYHIAAQYDGERSTLFVDGKPVAMTAGTGEVRRHNLPLAIGADVDGQGRIVDPIDGYIDAVRISNVARYNPARDFKPPVRAIADDQTVLALNFDLVIGGISFDESQTNAHVKVAEENIVPKEQPEGTEPAQPTDAAPAAPAAAPAPQATSSGAAESRPAIVAPATLRMPSIIAHRGASHDAPENTLPAFKLSFEQKADGFEGDFHLTADGQIVAMHDADLKRTGGVERKVSEMTLAEIRSLDVGGWKSPQFAGTVAPTLAECLAVLPKDKLFFIEIKCGPEIVPALNSTLASAGVSLSQLRVISFNADVIKAVKEQVPGMKAFWLTSFKAPEGQTQKQPTLDQVLEQLKAIHADGLDCRADVEVVNESFVAGLRQAGYEFHVWTVDDPAVANRMIQLGVDSITTNRPGFLREQLQPSR